MNTQALQKAVDLAGGQTALARALGLRQSTVRTWLERGSMRDPRHAIKIEQATNGAVTRSDLFPDLWPPQDDAA
jgi:DNA-binding transcriptional regulator YdaS (Cro superfamily)